MKKTLAVIGSGPSGLVSAKIAIENGLNVTVFEKNDSLGGNWNPIYGLTWSSMKTNISRYTMSFSDFSWDDSIPPYPNPSDVYKYLDDYATYFRIKSLIHFNTSVKFAKFETNNNSWLIEIEEVKNNTKKFIKFDYLIIASGVFSKPFIPNFRNKEIFQQNNLLIHSESYQQYRDKFKNKNVIVIGGSFSGSEIASDLVDHASSVLNVINKPYWILPRYISNNEKSKIPFDFVFYNRESCYKNESFENQNYDMSKICEKQLQIENLKIDSSSSEPLKVVVSDTYLNNIINNKIQLKSAKILYFDSDGVMFDDNTFIKADAVILCTGYSTSLDFIDNEILKIIEFSPNDRVQPLILYKSTIHPDIKNLAFVGLYRGTYFSILELQARWALMLFNGDVKLPNKEKIMNEMLNEIKIREQIPRLQFPYDNYVKLADSIAEEIHALPNFESIKLTNQKLYKQLWRDIVIPAHYRLMDNEQLAIEAIENIQNVINIFN